LRLPVSRAVYVIVGAMALAGVVSGCGTSSSGETVTTGDPASAFAPVVHHAPDEPHMPMSARWFIGRSLLGFAEDRGCADRPVAVGRVLRNQRDAVVDWIFLTGIGGRGPGYWRQPFKGSDCKLYRESYRYYPSHLTRPFDPSPQRARDLGPAEGWYLDLMDWARPGKGPRSAEQGRASQIEADAWYETTKQDVDGEPGLRISYWLLYGMHAPRDAAGRPVAALTHEGDWERVDVLLRGSGREWEPAGVLLRDVAGRIRRVDWGDLRHVGARGDRPAPATHPVFFAARGTHTLLVAPASEGTDAPIPTGGRVRIEETAVAPCPACPRWDTAASLSAARDRLWYGYGGSWGEPGVDDATTGPRGPGGKRGRLYKDADSAAPPGG
jgi:hypothetical protein